MLGDRLDRDNDLFSLAAITLDRSLRGCESGVLEGQGFAEPSGVKGGSVFHLGTRTNIWGIINANGHGAPLSRWVFCCYSRHARMARLQRLRAYEILAGWLGTLRYKNERANF